MKEMSSSVLIILNIMSSFLSSHEFDENNPKKEDVISCNSFAFHPSGDLKTQLKLKNR
jgi:hypothetical protein